VSEPGVDYVAYVEGRLAWLRRPAYLLCQDWHCADDLVQATLTRLFVYWPRAARRDNIDAYVRTILVRTFVSGRRSPWFRRVLLAGVQADRAAVYADPDAVLDVRDALAALLGSPAPRQALQAVGAPAAPTEFNALVPSASFGWLPPGFHTGAEGGTMSASTPVGLRLVAVSGGAMIELAVNPAGTCHLQRQTLACSAYNIASPVQSRAPDVHGYRAYWLQGAQLAWEYAPGAWSVLSWPDANAPWPPAGPAHGGAAGRRGRSVWAGHADQVPVPDFRPADGMAGIRGGLHRARRPAGSADAES
jgi:hypothetical protein